MRKKVEPKDVSNIATQKTELLKNIVKFTKEKSELNNNTPAKNKLDDLCPLLKKSTKKDNTIPKMAI